MDYKSLTKENGIGYTYWFENLQLLFEDYEASLPDSKELGIVYHQGKSVWDVFVSVRQSQPTT